MQPPDGSFVFMGLSWLPIFWFVHGLSLPISLFLTIVASIMMYIAFEGINSVIDWIKSQLPRPSVESNIVADLSEVREKVNLSIVAEECGLVLAIVVVDAIPLILAPEEINLPSSRLHLSLWESIFLVVMVYVALLLMTRHDSAPAGAVVLVLSALTYIIFLMIDLELPFFPYGTYPFSPVLRRLYDVVSQIALVLCPFPLIVTSLLAFNLMPGSVVTRTEIPALFLPVTAALIKGAGYLLPFLVPLNLFPLFSQGFWTLVGEMSWQSIAFFVLSVYFVPYSVALTIRLADLRRFTHESGSKKVAKLTLEQFLSKSEARLGLTEISRIKRSEPVYFGVRKMAYEQSEEFGRISTKVIVMMLVYPVLILFLLSGYMSLILALFLPPAVVSSWLGGSPSALGSLFGLNLGKIQATEIAASVVLSALVCAAMLLSSLSTKKRLAEFFDTAFASEVYVDSLLLLLEKYHAAVLRAEGEREALETLIEGLDRRVLGQERRT